ncbi:tannase [Acidovorax sp. Root275]|uniref:tannase/feruloyl esterase family alpha/beta hydrolase n=1 Tax=Acidovorax sp. Root275 TaxID=1736508 RepID=UPI00070B8F8E|nr:tannase/feruloyl esterase family alpha/beta hydrolase [Acidovorax sp. Root275]KRD42504.1 tannase [Acidovorax sp. Root275]
MTFNPPRATNAPPHRTRGTQGTAARNRPWAIGGLGAIAALTLAACGGGGSDAAPPLAAKPLAEACAAYTSAALPHGAKVTRTELRKADATLPDACIVRGEIVSSAESTIRWAVELPTLAQWNGKTLTIGGGGFDGFIPTDDPWYQQLVGPSAHAYVKISSDSGHQIRGFAWGKSDVALRNHAFDANHFVLEVGTAIATEFYGKRPARRYHMGHSNGGRSGLIATQKYPKDYDGVVAMEPAISQQAHQVNLGPTVLRHIFKSRDNWLSPAKIALYAKAETAACDGLDGLKDGIIGNVEACSYVPTDLLCKGADSDTCLTAGQIESIRLIYSDHRTPVTLSRGAVGYPRYGRGGASTSDWQSYMFGTSFDAPDSFNHMAVTEAARLVEGNPNASVLSHDPTQYQTQYARLAEMIDATDPDISAFADNGGKLLIWYGLGDTCVSVYRTADYFDSVKQRLGASKVQGFARMVTSPSNGHDLDGAGTEPRSIDLLAAMDAWVEKSTAPDKLVATKFAPGTSTPVAQRPVCEYPKFPRHNGTGDPSKAESFTCSAT